MGLVFEVVVPEVDEVHLEYDPRGSVAENAGRKNAWCARLQPGAWIIAADTVVEFEGRCIPKPTSIEEARAFLKRFSGREQRVHTGVALRDGAGGMVESVVTSGVRFKKLDDDTISEYFRRVDPLDKAGAYDIDQHGDLIVDTYSGSYTNIMGLPRDAVGEWLVNSAGLNIALQVE